jgi:gas vesicle protein
MSSSKIFLAFLGGAAAGAALMLFLSSEKGKQFRDNLADTARNAADSFFDNLEKIVDEAEAAAKAEKE